LDIIKLINYLAVAKEADLLMKEASVWIQSEIESIQNPSDCTSAKYMYCPVFNTCGAGCALHQVRNLSKIPVINTQSSLIVSSLDLPIREQLSLVKDGTISGNFTYLSF
jgi:hypothetical protein